MKRTLVAAAILLAPLPARAEGELTFRGRLSAEGTAIAAGTSGARLSPATGRWRASGLFVAAAASTFDSGSRLRLGGGAVIVGRDDGTLDGFGREAYARISALSWLDVEAGKRLVRWGVGYGFAPTGVLDPPRDGTDPTDRLSLNEGLMLARADIYRGSTSLTLAIAAPRMWREPAAETPHRLAAARLRTVLPHGVEVAGIVSAVPGDTAAAGANVTHVIGQRLEWHAELLVHDRDASTSPDRRGLSAAAGLQYTFDRGVNLVLEYHRDGHGLNNAEWDAVLRGARSAGHSPTRQHRVFARIVRSGTDRELSPELIVIAGLDERSSTIVPGLTWTPVPRVQLHGRVTRLIGGRRSVSSLAPWSTTLTAGATVRF